MSIFHFNVGSYLSKNITQYVAHGFMYPFSWQIMSVIYADC